MSANRRLDTLSLGAKLFLFAGLSVVLTTIVVTSVLDLDTRSTTTYRALFTDSTGLQPGDTVRIAGVEVGKVGSVGVLTGNGAQRCGLASNSLLSATDDPTCALVSFSVDSGPQLTTTSGAAVFYANLLGQRFLAITPGAPGGAPLRPGATIPISHTRPGLDLTEVFNGFAPLFNALSPAEVNQLSESIIQVFQGESGTVDSLVSQTASITTNLANREQVLNEVLQNLAGLLQAVNGQGTQLGHLIDNFSQLVSGLAGERNQLGSTISGFSQLNGAVASLLKQSRPSFDQAIGGLASATGTLVANQANLDRLVRGLPGLAQSLSKVASTGSYLDVYVCNLTINIAGTPNPPGGINISLVPGVPAPQYPQNVKLPSGRIGDQSQHTRNCQ